MGVDLGWMAVAGLSVEEVTRRLGLTDTGETTADYFEDDVGVATTPSGKVLLVSRSFTSRQLAKELSVGAEVYAADQVDMVGYSGCWAYRDGAEVWSAVIDPDFGTGELVSSGSLPPGIEDSDEAEEWGVPLAAARLTTEYLGEESVNGFDPTFRIFKQTTVTPEVERAEAARTADHKAKVRGMREGRRAENPGPLGWLKRLFA